LHAAGAAPLSKEHIAKRRGATPAISANVNPDTCCSSPRPFPFRRDWVLRIKQLRSVV
jgi:hypothetical protein